MADSKKLAVGRWVKAINTGNLDELDDIVKRGFIRHSQATPEVGVRSLADFKEFDRQSRVVFPDMRISLNMLVAEGDLVAFWGQFSGTQTGPWGPFPASQKQTCVDIAGMFRFEDDKIAELWITWDNLAGLTQLGHLPTPG